MGLDARCQLIASFFVSPTFYDPPTFFVSHFLIFSMPCQPPYYASPGHEDKHKHDRVASCMYYVVCVGWHRGIFSSSWIARAQTDGFSDSKSKSFRNWSGAIEYWDDHCARNHGPTCPDFPLLPFSLTMDPIRQPGPPPCTHPLVPSTSQAPPPLVSTSWAPTPPPVVTVSIPSAKAGTPRIITTLPIRPRLSKQTEACSPWPVKTKEPKSPHLALCVTPYTCVQLMLTGRALAARFDAPATTLTPTMAHEVGQLVFPLSTCDAAGAGDPVARQTGPAAGGVARTPILSLLATPWPSHCVTPTTAPAPAIPAPRVHQYGIWGITVFFNSHASVKAAATKLGLANAKIMFSDNTNKLEAWMTGKPFLGEDV
ncbi:hypothetical protein C8R44DRAFT_886069 [Mycena epipterygia]|nr:hypothetical protein C8R44DRAFT_886069 [Mycena epipterygia]